jgi:hypothetical protein
VAAWIVVAVFAAAALGVVSCVHDGGIAPEIERPSSRWAIPRADHNWPDEDARNWLFLPLDPRFDLVKPFGPSS